MIARAREEDVMASFLAVRPNYSFHVVSMDDPTGACTRCAT